MQGPTWHHATDSASAMPPDLDVGGRLRVHERLFRVLLWLLALRLHLLLRLQEFEGTTRGIVRF